MFSPQNKKILKSGYLQWPQMYNLGYRSDLDMNNSEVG